MQLIIVSIRCYALYSEIDCDPAKLQADAVLAEATGISQELCFGRIYMCKSLNQLRATQSATREMFTNPTSYAGRADRWLQPMLTNSTER